MGISAAPARKVVRPFSLTQGVVGMARYNFEYAAECGRVFEANQLAELAIDELDPVCNHCFVQLPQSLDEKPLSVDWMVTILLNSPRLLASICLSSPLKPESLSQ